MGRNYKISCVSIPTLGDFNDVAFFSNHFKLRDLELNQKLGWQLPSWEGYEYDDLDTPAATYFIVRSDRKDPRFGDVAGAARIVPTTCPTGYMLKNSFQHAVRYEQLPHTPRCWEGSVAVTNDSLPREERSHVFRLFAAAYLEFLVERKAEWMYGLAIQKIWDRWTQFGWPLTKLGPTVPFKDGTEGTAGKLPVSQLWLERARVSAGLDATTPILDYGNKARQLALEG